MEDEAEEVLPKALAGAEWKAAADEDHQRDQGQEAEGARHLPQERVLPRGLVAGREVVGHDHAEVEQADQGQDQGQDAQADGEGEAGGAHTGRLRKGPAEGALCGRADREWTSGTSGG
jgi:hypothetical protein